MSHVAMEEKLCPVCRERHPTGVLLDRRLRENAFDERSYVTGMQLCPSHRKIADDEDRIYVLEADITKSEPGKSVFFLSGIAAIRWEAFVEIVDEDALPMDAIHKYRYLLTDHDTFMTLTQIVGATQVGDDHPSINPPKEYDA